MINYGFTKEVNSNFPKTVDIVTEALKKEGFGILTKIDLKEKFKEKLGIDFKNYVILGACNPKKAYEAVSLEENIGLMLPCNVIVYEKGSKTVVSVMRPTAAMQKVNNPQLSELAKEVEQLLKRAFDSIG